MNPGSRWARLAAATGLDFVVAVAVVAIIGRAKHFKTPDFATAASNNVFGTAAFLLGVAAFFLFWFAGTLAARMRQLEGGSGRLAAIVNGSGAALAAIIALGVGVLFAARSGSSKDLATLAGGLLDGPMWYFPAAAFIGASGIVAIRADDIPLYSQVVARLSVLLSAAYVGGAGLMLFRDYAWINDTAYITFLAWVLVVSIIGIVRWTEMDSRRAAAGSERSAPTRAPRPSPARTVREVNELPEDLRTQPVALRKIPSRKPAPRKRTPRKPTTS